MSPRKEILNIDNICALIRTCGEVGVKEVSFGRLHVVFGRKDQDTQASSPNLPDKALSEQSQSIEQRAFEQDEISTKDDQLAELVITDPLEYERLVASGDLENGDQAEDH